MIPQELQRLKTLGYKVFEAGPYDLNFIGVRGPGRDQHGNPMDDTFLMFYKDEQGVWKKEWFMGTTDPMSFYLGTPMNVDGTAIMCEGQHRGLWKLGLHKGREALKQSGPVKVYRDKDRDMILDMDPQNTQTGQYAINFHGPGGNLAYASAGCQVATDWKHVARVRELLALQTKHGFGDSITYTLVKKEDLYP